ncbi:MAG TPA: hypothetical protein VGS98_05350 [Thermoanaerobaculia bacterium]|nr:hypothetical protein [Thermoanaerobaculia bacterium]
MKNLAGVAVGLLLCVTFSGCSFRRASTPPPPSAQGADSKTREEAFRASVKDLAKKIGAPESDVAGVAQEDVTWPDSCLGCVKTGETCAQVLTPGYRIVLRVRDATYEYHTNRGDRVRLCNQSLVPPGAPTPPNS